MKDQSTTLACPVCGHANREGALFCQQCTSPIAVAGLHEFTQRDREICMGALMDVMGDAMRCLGGDDRATDLDLWHAYLSAQWLRPETALIQFAEALAIQKLTQHTRGPWLDLGCGDGVHAALYSGWRFEEPFDVFQSLDPAAADVYNHWNPVEFQATVRRAGRTVDHGIDIKPTAVARAAALGAFKSVTQSDAAHINLPDKGVSVIFSNMLRDLGEPLGAALAECRRILRDDGLLLISAMTPAYRKHLYFAPLAREAEKAGKLDEARQLLRLDRGRSVFCQRQLSIEQWQRLLSDHGLKIAAVEPIVGQHVIRFWDVGLRPFTTALLAQRQHWNETGSLADIKKSAMSALESTLQPLVRNLHTGEICMNLLAVRKG